jgi:hypothetical protein
MKKSQVFGMALLMAVLPGLPAAAQASSTAESKESRFSADLKLHFGWSPAERDNLHHDYQVVGVDFGYRTDLGRVGLELGWFYKTGDGFVQGLGADPTVPPVVYVYDGQGNLVLSPQASAVPISRFYSGDSRRNDLNGIMARLSLTRPLTENLDWQVGFQVGGTLWNQQYFGDISGGRPTPTGDNASAVTRTWVWRDLYNGNLKGHFVGISPYAGIKFEIGHNGALEFNALLLNYQSRAYVHIPGMASRYSAALDYSGKQVCPVSGQNDFPLDSVQSRTHYAPQIEMAYIYHF